MEPDQMNVGSGAELVLLDPMQKSVCSYGGSVLDDPGTTVQD